MRWKRNHLEHYNKEETVLNDHGNGLSFLQNLAAMCLSLWRQAQYLFVFIQRQLLF